ncbi:putative sugar epimerase YhfK [Jeotgalicoccus saudimassiliensis]|uniref:Putative sugar epimerase YhfK n=1 Tax=Jeotgalicoccus saudimassiliensis TaxID=1461582 RepID=A0A078M2U0_9STAP|nr:NAD(P)-binding oxidoreductase [Jeotgalicoccus saudimassiliensis]CEA01738.1 putative sugar epimerase YhfK [Jeotgalicoccus saudimassiliensis]
MSILVIGANGGVGTHLVQQLKENSADFTAGVRKDEQVSDLNNKDVKALLIDVEKDSIEELAEKIKGFEQVVFSVGSGGGTGADQTIIVDLDGAVKAVDASKDAGVKHFVMVSTWDSRREAFDAPGAEKLKPYTIAKHHADVHLRNSGLTYTIVHPGILTDEDGSGKVDVDLYFEDVGDVSRENVAHVLYEVVTDESNRGKELQVLDGSTPAPEAVKNFNNK